MTLNAVFTLNLYADITPGDSLSSGSYRLGFPSTSFTIPADADVIITRSLTTAVGGKIYEPDVNTHDSVVGKDSDGVTVGLDRVYTIALRNADATNGVTFLCANMDSGSWSGTLNPVSGLAIAHWPSGVTVGATSTITLTSLAGTPTVDLFLIGRTSS